MWTLLWPVISFGMFRDSPYLTVWCATIGLALVMFDYFVVVRSEDNERCTNALISSAKKIVEKSP